MQLRLDVSAQGGGRVLATLADNDLQVPEMHYLLPNSCFLPIAALMYQSLLHICTWFSADIFNSAPAAARPADNQASGGSRIF